MPRPELPPQPDHTTAIRVIAFVFLLVIASVVTVIYKWLG